VPHKVVVKNFSKTEIKTHFIAILTGNEIRQASVFINFNLFRWYEKMALKSFARTSTRLLKFSPLPARLMAVTLRLL
jgi:predicted lipoprotein